MPNPVRYNEKEDKLYAGFEEAYRIVKIIRHGRHEIVRQLYSPGLAKVGVDAMHGTVEIQAHYFGKIELIVTKDGRSRKTAFSCQTYIDNVLRFD